MARNIEIKAKINHLAEFESRAEAISGDTPTLITQSDVFFPCAHGRLKLRLLGETLGELIHYQRPDQPGPKLSDYSISITDRPQDLRATLSAALGELAVVNKLRRLYMAGRTRIHIDTVEGLGDYLELEVVLAEGESVIAGELEADQLMDALGIEKSDLIEGAYVDLLLQAASQAKAHSS